MDTEKALLAAIWASPHDDLPRLVYADWLDEIGDPAKAARAEFIRVQCELARVGQWDDRSPPLAERERHLAAEWRTWWLPRQKLRHAGVGFHRGFFCPGYTDLRQLRSEASVVRAAAPLYDLWLEHPDGFEGLLKWPPAEGLQSLRLSRRFAWWGKHLAESPFTRNLARLTVDHPHPSPGDLCRTSHFAHLTELRLPEMETTADVLDALLAAPFAPQLRRLALGGRGPTPSAALARPLAAAALPRLEEYSVHAPDAHYDWSDLFRALAGSDTGNGLRRLGLFGGWVSDAACLELLRWPGARTLRSLALNVRHTSAATNPLRVETLAAVLESDGLPGLKSLSACPVNYDRRVSVDPDGRVAKLRRLARERGVQLELG